MQQDSLKFILISVLEFSCLQQVFPKKNEKHSLVSNEGSKLKLDNMFKSILNVDPNPEETGTYFEGDIREQRSILRNGIIDKNLQWKNGVVPVELRGDFNFYELNVVNEAFEVYHNQTCIRFVQHSIEDDFIVISSKPTGCWSSLGRTGGQQYLNLQSPMCFFKVGTALHELMHALGFNHEHTREDRDEYVEILWTNVPRDAYKNFAKASPNATNTFDIEYDYNSVLHYSPYAFAADPSKPTIRAVEEWDSAMNYPIWIYKKFGKCTTVKRQLKFDSN